MALPAGVTTATVVAGVPVTHTGAPVKTFVSIEPSVYLVHVDPVTGVGTPLVDFMEEMDISEGVAGQFTLPHTDQAGFTDENGNAYTNWYYTARVTYSTPSKAKNKTPKVKVFQLTTGQTTVDLDLLPSGAPALPYIAPTATVTAFGGRTGPVTLQESDLPERLSDTSLSATYATPASVSSAIAAIPAPAASGVLPTGTPEVQDGKLFVTNSETAIRTQVTTTQTLTGTPSTLGNGVAATVDGVDVWVSPSGYMRPKVTNFAKSSLWGSSSAANLGPELSAEMAALGSDMHHTSGAVGSYQMSHISAATGIRPMEVAAVTIPASGGVTIVPTNMPEANNTAIPVNWPGSFAGIPGAVTKSAGSSVWTFTRTSAGTATAIPAGSKFIPSKPVEYQSGVTFLNLAKNTLTAPTAWGTYEECIRLTNLTYEYFSGAGRHVIMLGHYQTSPHPSGSAGFTAIANYNAYVKARYGARYIDIQAYLSSAQVWTDTGLTPTQADLDAQAAQTLPPSLQLDASHLNGAGDTAVAKLIKARLQTLGWTVPVVDYAFTLTGVPTPSAQWNANSIPVATGADVTTWGPAAGGGALVSPNSAKAPSLEATGTEKYVRFVAADAELDWAGWSAFGTVTVITRVSNFTGGSPIVNMGTVTLQRSGSGNLAGYGGSFLTTPMSTDAWHVASLVLDGASSIVALDQTTATGTIGAGTQSAFKLSKLDNLATIEIAAVIGWTEKLTAAQLQSVATQLKAVRPALMP